MVTVLCTCYNHAEYIKSALEGFVNQRTDFTYKVIIHDDASTDESQKIIMEYAKKYPNIIIPIIQKENQYSKNVDIYEEILYPLVKSKYVAFCEGDDYWTDNHKLQKQFDYMEENDQCSMVVHNTEKIILTGNNWKELVNNNAQEIDYDASEIIEAGGGGLFQTSSYFCRADILFAMPDYFAMKGVGDYPLAIYMGTKGNVHYFPDVMSVYRVGGVNSWSNSFFKDRKNRLEHYADSIEYFKNLDYYTERKYHAACETVINRNTYKYLYTNYQIKEIWKNKSFRKIFCANGIKTKIYYLIELLTYKIRES